MTHALSVRGLRKHYDDVVAVDGLDLTVERGECFGLLGPNGAGKTTTIEICEGLNTPDGGEVEVLGLRWATDARTLRQRLGIQLQETQLAEKLTVEETLRLFRSFYERGPAVGELLAVVQLEEKRGARVGTLSGGQKQRLAVACALAGDPELLFLDEPTTGLDPQSRRQLWALVERFRAAGRTILLTTHYMDEAQRLCDRVAIVDHGRVIAEGTPRDLILGLGAEHVVEFATAGDAAPAAGADGIPLDARERVLPLDARERVLPLDALEQLPGVRSARTIEDGVALQVTELHEAVPALLAALAERRLALAQLRTHSATLEDVFVSLTGRQLRDV